MQKTIENQLKKLVILDDSTLDENDVNVGSSSTVCNISLLAPLHLVTSWTEPGTTRKRATVVIPLPSGIAPIDFLLKVLAGGRRLNVTAKWSQ